MNKHIEKVTEPYVRQDDEGMRPHMVPLANNLAKKKIKPKANPEFDRLINEQRKRERAK